MKQAWRHPFYSYCPRCGQNCIDSGGPRCWVCQKKVISAEKAAQSFQDVLETMTLYHLTINKSAYSGRLFGVVGG